MSTFSHECDADPAQQSPADIPEFDDAAAAGDWDLFRRRCRFVEASTIISTQDALGLKQRFALAYMGTRAQAAGGVYMRLRPSVFTPAFIEQLSSDNSAARFARYPWLERLLHLLQQLDQDQYANAAPHGNIVSFVRRFPKLQSVPATPA